MNKKYFLIPLVLIVSAVIFLRIFYFAPVKMGNRYFLARLALNGEQKKKGLGGRNSLCPHCAMLFVFEKSKTAPFWMKGMKFDLDIIWISQNRIVAIKKNFSRLSGETIAPEQKADSVLEINAGLADEIGIEIGDKVNVY